VSSLPMPSYCPRVAGIFHVRHGNPFAGTSRESRRAIDLTRAQGQDGDIVGGRAAATVLEPPEVVMFLSVHEQERLMVHMAGKLALERKERGLALNLPEATALITSYLLEGAR